MGRLLFWSSLVLLIILSPRLYRWHLSRKEQAARITYGGRPAKAVPFPWGAVPFPWGAVLLTLGLVALLGFVIWRCGPVR